MIQKAEYLEKLRKKKQNYNSLAIEFLPHVQHW